MSKLDIGVIVGIYAEDMQKVVDLGLRSCQVCSWKVDEWTDERFERLLAAAKEKQIEITTFWSGYPGPEVWNFTEGPATIGLVPPKYRAERVEALKKAAGLAAKFKLPSITTHLGFLPEDPNDPNYEPVVEAIREVARRCAELGVEFWFETGQETPVTMLRTIERVGTDNCRINLDPANLILYGKGNPVDALDVFGQYIRGVHAKDGLYPTNGTELGREVPIGQGKVDFAALIGRLKELGYSGALTIEREITGSQQTADIREAIEYLRTIC